MTAPMIRKASILLFVLSVWLAIPSAFSATDTKTSTPAKESSKTAVRDIPVQDIFDTSSAKVEAVADSLEYSTESGK